MCVCVCVVCVFVCVHLGHYYLHTQEAGKEECELEDFSQTSNGTELKAYVLVNLDNEIAYGFKVRTFL